MQEGVEQRSATPPTNTAIQVARQDFFKSLSHPPTWSSTSRSSVQIPHRRPNNTAAAVGRSPSSAKQQQAVQTDPFCGCGRECDAGRRPPALRTALADRIDTIERSSSCEEESLRRRRHKERGRSGAQNQDPREQQSLSAQHPRVQPCKSAALGRVLLEADTTRKSLLASKSLPNIKADNSTKPPDPSLAPSSGRHLSSKSTLSTEEAFKRLNSWRKTTISRKKSEMT